jgi:trans-2,3-dihydro-3-hydroxyanthranilate isomerase
MPKLKFFIVDVFAQEKYTGNQLAVFIVDPSVSAEQMQKIAKEMNYSETTFITSLEQHQGGYDVRIFTPKEEIPFAGHPTLGTAFVIYQEIIQKPIETIHLNFPVGQIPVNLYYQNASVDVLWMQQKQPTFHQTLAAADLANVLNLKVDDIDTRFPIQEVSTGLPFIIVPLKMLRALKSIKLNKDKYFDLIQTMTAKAILAFCPETYHAENDLSVRVFVEYFGIPEDPATGSANGCLAGYLLQYAYFGKESIDLKVEQGYEIDRPSLLLLKAEKKEETIDVFVGGKVISVAQGEFV